LSQADFGNNEVPQDASRFLQLQIRKIDREIAAEIFGWRYPGELAIYSQEEIRENSSVYFAIVESASLVGFGVIGAEAIEKGFRGLRCAILDWNIVSKKMATSFGFRPTRKITNYLGTFEEFECTFCATYRS
jgi:hypothetical protein